VSTVSRRHPGQQRSLQAAVAPADDGQQHRSSRWRGPAGRARCRSRSAARAPHPAVPVEQPAGQRQQAGLAELLHKARSYVSPGPAASLPRTGRRADRPRPAHHGRPVVAGTEAPTFTGRAPAAADREAGDLCSVSVGVKSTHASPPGRPARARPPRTAGSGSYRPRCQAPAEQELMNRADPRRRRGAFRAAQRQAASAPTAVGHAQELPTAASCPGSARVPGGHRPRAGERGTQVSTTGEASATSAPSCSITRGSVLSPLSESWRSGPPPRRRALIPGHGTRSWPARCGDRQPSGLPSTQSSGTNTRRERLVEHGPAGDLPQRRISMPSLCMSTRKKVSPRCLGRPVGAARQIAQSASRERGPHLLAGQRHPPAPASRFRFAGPPRAPRFRFACSRAPAPPRAAPVCSEARSEPAPVR